MISSIAESLSHNLGSRVKDSYYDALLIFPENSISNLFANKFDITDAKDLEKFHQAFRICTEGQGNELKSVNNIISSAILPLLTFFRLFGEKSGLSLNLKLDDKSDSIEFNRCFFEVRNKVVTETRPSCVDVALCSSDGKVMLFLESKLSEYNSVSKNLEIKKGYSELYNDENFREILKAGDIIIDGNKLKLKSGEKAYFKGIKQTISHPIGLVQGPSENRTGVYYPGEYLSSYKSCFNKAATIYYATIILNPKKIREPNDVGDTDCFNAHENYVNLYKRTIGANGAEIINCIRGWNKLKTIIKILLS